MSIGFLSSARMRLDRELTLHVFQPLNKLRKDRLPILMYHSISDDAESARKPYYRVCTSPKRFAQQMTWLSDLGYSGVSLEKALALHGKTEKRLAAITFDDGFRNVFTEAWPVLEKHNFTATMYLPTAFIADHRQAQSGRECLTWDEVRTLKKLGAQFGSHSVNHLTMYTISWRHIERELAESKGRIEQETHDDVSSFAYPFAFPQEDGHFTKRFLEMVVAAGYRNCVVTMIGSVRNGHDCLLLKRLPVNECDDRALLASKLAGAYDWMLAPQWFVRRCKGWMGATRRLESD